MRTKKLLVIILVTLMRCIHVYASCAEVIPVTLYYAGTYVLNGNTRPSRAPHKHDTSPDVFLDENAMRLLFVVEGNETYRYFIYDENGCEILQGVLTVSEGMLASIDLSTFLSGSYRLCVLYNNQSFIGTFVLQ